MLRVEQAGCHGLEATLEGAAAWTRRRHPVRLWHQAPYGLKMVVRQGRVRSGAASTGRSGWHVKLDVEELRCDSDTSPGVSASTPYTSPSSPRLLRTKTPLASARCLLLACTDPACAPCLFWPPSPDSRRGRHGWGKRDHLRIQSSIHHKYTLQGRRSSGTLTCASAGGELP